MKSYAKRVLPLVLLLLLTPGSPSLAVSYVLVPDARLADQAQIVARVEITGARVEADPSAIWTLYEARVLDAIKGDARDSRVQFAVIGGRRAGGGTVLEVPGAPHFRVGERALLFLGQGSAGRHRVLHLFQGVFRPLKAGDRDLLKRDGGVGPEERAREEARFVEWLRDRAAGVVRPPDYLTRSTPSGRARPKFQLLSNATRFRWFEFDRGEVVPWYRHKAGQRGLKKGGVAAFKRAVRAWNQGRSGAPVRFRPAGSTQSKAGFSRLDGQNTITFRDFNDILGAPFDCDDGGILALGGVLTSGTPRPWKGQPHRPIQEGEVLINDGVQCLFKVYPSVATQVYVHELGHALGLGHSCFAAGQPACDRVLGDATMRAFLHVPERAARLGADDLAGIQQLYHPDTYAAPCRLQPGKRSFCGKCGPCGEGQGNCRSDSQCFGDLICKENVGAGFGFDPETNVCVTSD